jgi:hypothetical protein
VQFDPVEQILEVIIAHPKLFQEHGDKRILNLLFDENRFVMDKKRLLRETSHVIDVSKVRTYLEEYRVFRSIIERARNLPLWVFEKEEGNGVERDRECLYLAVSRLETDLDLLNRLVPRFKNEVKGFFLRFSLKPNWPMATRELETLFDRITNNLVIVQYGMQQLADSSMGRTMIMPETDEIAVFEELIHEILNLLERLEGFIRSIFLPFLDTSPVRLLDGEGLQELEIQLIDLTKNALKIQQLAESNEKN